MSKVNLSVRLVGDKDNRRAALFASIINTLPEYVLDSQGVSNQINPSSDYNIIFNFNKLSNLKNLQIPLKNHKEKFIIYDISEDVFEDPKWGPITTLLTVCSNFVTCSNEILQERIYEITGRLAAIVRDPIKDIGKKPEIVNTKEYLWFGSLSDIFSVYKYRDDNRVAIEPYLTPKFFKRLMDKYDIIFLPPTPTAEGEARRKQKIDFCTLAGKAVVTNLNKKLPNKKKLEEQILKAQQEIEKTQGIEAVKKQLKWALAETPRDDFLDYLNSSTGDSAI